MMPEPEGRKRGLLKLGALVLIAIGVGFGSVGGILFNLHAPQLTADGEIFNVVRHGGKTSSTAFGLRVATGEIDGLHLSSDITEIRDGETANVAYQAGSHAVLALQIEQGPYSGYAATGRSGMFGACCALLLGLVCAAYGIVDWFSDGTAASVDSDDKAPDADVDTRSMLNLSPHDE